MRYLWPVVGNRCNDTRYSGNHDAVLVTSDKVQKEVAEAQGLEAIYLKQEMVAYKDLEIGKYFVTTPCPYTSGKRGTTGKEGYTGNKAGKNR